MRLRFRNIVLRDFKAGDEEDMVRWMTVQTEWHDHDSPWLAERDFKAFDPEKYRSMAREYLQRPRRFGERSVLQIEDEMTGRHIGFVSAYYIGKQDEPLPAGELSYRIALGIDICEPAFRGEQRGTNALLAFVQYIFCHNWPVVFLQTWTGNRRMMHVAEKMGFRRFRVKKGVYTKEGVEYDNITYYLEAKTFKKVMPVLERAKIRLCTLLW